MNVILVLIALTPVMYAQVLLESLHRKRPDWQVISVPPKQLYEAVEVYDPDAIVRVDAQDVSEFPDMIALITIDITDSLYAYIRVRGEIQKVEDIDLDTMLAALDTAEKSDGHRS